MKDYRNIPDNVDGRSLEGNIRIQHDIYPMKRDRSVPLYL